jgi:hypothetical protein
VIAGVVAPEDINATEKAIIPNEMNAGKYLRKAIVNNYTIIAGELATYLNKTSEVLKTSDVCFWITPRPPVGRS